MERRTENIQLIQMGERLRACKRLIARIALGERWTNEREVNAVPSRQSLKWECVVVKKFLKLLSEMFAE
jgi:hypothetical protein